MAAFVGALEYALGSEMPMEMAEVLGLKYNEAHETLGYLVDDRQVSQLCSGLRLGGGWREVVEGHLRAFAALQRGAFVEAYDHQNLLLQSFYDVFEQGNNWLLPALHRLIQDLRFLAVQADVAGGGAGSKDDKLKEAERTLKKAFKLCITDRAELSVSKKWGCVPSLRRHERPVAIPAICVHACLVMARI